jgi:hypothetical protein
MHICLYHRADSNTDAEASSPGKGLQDPALVSRGKPH